MLRPALLCVVALWCSSALGCASEDDPGASGPPLNRMFVGNVGNGVNGWIEDPVAFAMGGGRVYFDDTSCWIPDADSFDDFEDTQAGIPRGVTPVSVSCTADGVVTGPLQFEASRDAMDLLPSKWCPSMHADCTPVGTASGSEGGGYYSGR